MFLAIVVTDRPGDLQVDQWALRDGEPFRAHVVGTSAVDQVLWDSDEVLVVDVLEMELLIELYGDRRSMTLLVGAGLADELLMVDFYRLGYCNASARIDRFDPRSALMAILDRFRRGEFRSVERVLTRA
jgi:hypothetical protein